MASESMRSARPLLLGHRGCRQKGTAENTFPAFDLALHSGCDGFEFDVRLTADARAVICHDPKLRGLDIARTELSALIAAPSRNFGLRSSAANGEEVPCLEQVLERYGTRAFLDIELKVGGLEEATLAAIRSVGNLRGCVISSFLAGVVRRLHELDSTAQLGYIFDSRSAMRMWSTLPILWVMPNYKLVNEERVHDFHQAGKRVMVWTVNAPKDMLRMAKDGVDAIVADDPQLLCETLGTFPFESLS